MKNLARRGGGSGVVLVAVAVVALAACSDDATNFDPSVDASTLDAHVTPHDAGHGVDANCVNTFAGCGNDAAATGNDRDAGVDDADATDDAEAASDAALDAPADATVDAASDTGTADTGTDAAIDSGVDAAPVDSGVDAGVDAAVDSGVDAGVDAAPPVDAGITCAPGEVLCNGACIDPNTNASFCGASGACTGRTAGAVCTAAQICGNSTCNTLAPKRVFVTSTAFAVTGARGIQSVASADAVCQQMQPRGAAVASFKAWLSDATSTPAVRFSRAGSPYRLITGTTVAEDWAGLTSGTLKAAINVTETGGAPGTGTLSTATRGAFNVFTGTNADGTSASTKNTDYTCAGWTSAGRTAAVAVGASTAVTLAWSNGPVGSNGSEGLYCGDTASIYCVEQ